MASIDLFELTVLAQCGIAMILTHGRQSWGGYIPPCFWEGGDGQCFHPPPLEMNEALAYPI